MFDLWERIWRNGWDGEGGFGEKDGRIGALRGKVLLVICYWRKGQGKEEIGNRNK